MHEKALSYHKYKLHFKNVVSIVFKVKLKSGKTDS